MADSSGPTSAAPPVAGQPAPAAFGGPAAIDPVAVIRSRPYIAALALAAILGIPISAIAYGFLALVAAIQQLLFSELPNQIFGGLHPRGGRCLGWCCARARSTSDRDRWRARGTDRTPCEEGRAAGATRGLFDHL